MTGSDRRRILASKLYQRSRELVEGAASPETHPIEHATAKRGHVSLKPTAYSEARVIGERYREGHSVDVDLTAMSDKDAMRLVDFMAGMVFVARGTIERVESKTFILRGPDDKRTGNALEPERFLYVAPKF